MEVSPDVHESSYSLHPRHLLHVTVEHSACSYQIYSKFEDPSVENNAWIYREEQRQSTPTGHSIYTIWFISLRNWDLNKKSTHISVLYTMVGWIGYLFISVDEVLHSHWVIGNLLHFWMVKVEVNGTWFELS